MKIYELLEMAKKGDENAVIDIFSRFKGTIKKFSKKLRYEEAETDLTIAFLVIIKEIDLKKFQLKNEGAIVNFIYCCLKNKYADLYKNKKKAFESIYTSSELKLDTIADDRCEDADSKLFVSMLINSLPPLQKNVIEKKFIQDFSDKEIGFLLGISRQAVNRAKNRGLNNLRKALEEMEDRRWKRKYLI